MGFWQKRMSEVVKITATVTPLVNNPGAFYFFHREKIAYISQLL
jgi:hypothetical protein